MKILLVNKFLYPKGGDAVITLNTGKLLSSRGHDVVFWGMGHPLNPEYPYKDCFVSYIDYYNPGSFKKQLTMASKMFYSFEAKRKIEDVIKREKPDVAHLHNFAHQISPSILPVFKKYKIPVVMTMHDYKLVCPTYSMLLHGKPCEKCKNGRYYQCLINTCAKNSYLKSLLNTLEMYLHHHVLHIYNLIDIYISPSRFLKAACEKMGFDREIVYLPNFVNLEDFKPQYTWEEDSIVYVGRLSEGKGLLTLINAMKGLDIELKIIGEGKLRESLKLWVRGQELHNVRFLGYKSGEGLKDEIRKSMFVVLPSEWCENNPMSIIEGFALGKPAVGTRMGGIPELVKEGETGLTFEPGNSDDLRSKIEYLRKTPDKIVEMAKNARAFVEQELNAEKHYQRLMGIYQQVS